ncbi:lipopolysaccharide export system permease protein [Salegentibacter sp. 24]|uniref:LptF/LptG family permease n=1 Tax=Salegentibacter sp. 24 TaxID=2183986 RepID=UPI001061C973|nr:LptF/LptG family permease [Salegentibacter sp. 24]TDN84692.1 lipopolysaccharide export system permease protein [Salegentibacter sp. 24]
MKILDWYILKRYLGTFSLMLLLFIPIGITVNLAEKIGKILANEVPFIEVVFYYIDFTIYFANLLFPLFLFLSVIWFTSKLANNTEIIAFLSSGVSFWRFLRPYLVGATIVCIFALILGMFLAPKASKGFNEFKYEYLKKDIETKETRDVYRQINDNEYIYASHFQPLTNSARNFTLEHFEGNKLQFKISASSLRFNEEDSIYSLTNVDKRIVGVDGDSIIHQNKLDTILPFEFDELTPDAYIAETLNYSELNEFIETERRRGSGNINRYLVVAYKRWSLPVSAFILTIIAVAVSSMKRRGGMGVNLAVGITLAFVFIFFDKVFGTMAEQSTFSPLIAVWFPNITFGILAIFLLYRAKR